MLIMPVKEMNATFLVGQLRSWEVYFSVVCDYLYALLTRLRHFLPDLYMSALLSVTAFLTFDVGNADLLS
jgi:hypothetical protein